MITKIINSSSYLISNLFAALLFTACIQNQASTINNKAKLNRMTTGNVDTATFGAGCFWCVEAVFQQLDGVLKVTSGYSGGHIANPTYKEICTKKTGHVEVCQIVYDTKKISFDELLQVFWKTHDPTTVDQQGNDKGPQYRSVIFYRNAEQKKLSEKYKQELNNAMAYSDPIVTSIEPIKDFYIAEDYHQNYYNGNMNAMYCRYVIQPKLEKFEKVFKDKLKQSKTM